MKKFENFLEETLPGNFICTAGFFVFLYALGVMMTCVGRVRWVCVNFY